MIRFVHIPKTAGVSICRAIAQLPGHRRIDNRAAYVFSCVRNPYDRAVSLYYFLKDRSEQYKAQFMAEGETVNSFWTEKASHIRPITFTQPQAAWLKKAGNIDMLLRYETLADDWPAFAKKHNLPDLLHKNKSRQRPVIPWQEELSDESVAIIGKLYADDFAKLEYERLI